MRKLCPNKTHLPLRDSVGTVVIKSSSGSRWKQERREVGESENIYLFLCNLATALRNLHIAINRLKLMYMFRKGSLMYIPVLHVLTYSNNLVCLSLQSLPLRQCAAWQETQLLGATWLWAASQVMENLPLITNGPRLHPRPRSSSPQCKVSIS